MKEYTRLVQHVLSTGTRKENRTGVDTLSTFGYYYEHDMRDGFPLLTTKAVSWKNIVVEMLWFLSGQTDISILKRHGCKFWDAWADENGKVPSAYGNFWRQFPTHPKDTPIPYTTERWHPEHNDQLRWVLDEMKKNPMSRRMVVSAWAPGNAQTSKLPPCHCLFMFNVQNDDSHLDSPWEAVDSSYQDTSLLGVVWADTEEKAYELALHKYGPQYETLPDGEKSNCLHVRRPMDQRLVEYRKERQAQDPTRRLCLHLTQRSCDVALGVPYNIASYGLLLSLFSRFSGIEAGVFGHTLVDAHIYTSKPDGSKAEFDHVPGLKEQIQREPRKLPKLHIADSIRDLTDIEKLMFSDVTTEEVMKHFVLEGYQPHEAINFKVAV
jgi:thymidylate synthase